MSKKFKHAIVDEKMVELTPELLAEMFCELRSDEHVRFFNRVAEVTTTWPGMGLAMQLQYITDDDALSLGGRRVMDCIGEYSHWGLVPRPTPLVRGEHLQRGVGRQVADPHDQGGGPPVLPGRCAGRVHQHGRAKGAYTLMSYTVEGVLEIPIEDWLEFLDKYRPGAGDGAETLFGAPVMHTGYVEIPYAAGSDSDPREWSVPPAFLKPPGDGKRMER